LRFLGTSGIIAAYSAWLEKHLMSCHFEFDSTNRILRCRIEGRVADETLKKYYGLAAKFVALNAPCAGIFDMSAVTYFNVSPDTIRELANLPPAVADPNRPRFIVAASAHIFGMARMFELQGQSTRPNLHVVRTANEVWVILGVQEPHFEPIQTE
jgi:hypothetical protein